MSSLRFAFLLLAAAVSVAVSVELHLGTDKVFAEPNSASVPTNLRLAYIYQSDKRSADSFRDFLEEADCSVRQIHCDAVAETDFRPFAAILIGSDTNRVWRGLAKAVDNARKPILGLGEGGYYFFGDLKLAIGAPQGWHGNKTGVRPVNPAKSRFWSFRKGRNQLEEPITIYETTNHVGIYLLKPAKDVLLLGREENDAHHYPLLQQGPHYVFWGFTASPDQMTRAGKDLFIATCRYAAGLDESPVEDTLVEEAIDPFRKKVTSKAP
jgi:hypothetical protein